MPMLIYSHPAGFAHDTGPRHPEKPERLRSVLAALEADNLSDLAVKDAPLASTKQLELVHNPDHVSRLLDVIPDSGLAHIDADTVVSPGSREAALRAVGAVCAAVDDVFEGSANAVFCAVRPPGHHAEPERAMGFCLFNNIAIGAMHARVKHSAERVAVVDFDVHHGNGTQSAFENDANLFYGSTHQYPFYPGTGARSETGVANNIVNLPLAMNSGSEEFRAAFTNVMLPALIEFAPDLIMISAGFDAHRDDPLGQLQLVDEDYTWVTERLCEISNDLSGSRIVSSLEGGYDLEALGRCAAVHVGVLKGL
jgi:acetoin utilization deacetylase AcuC-like enzyme